MVKHAVTLDDKYTREEGRVFASSVQALTRLPLVQKRLDEMAGLNTAGFISGYRGSPIGVYDAALWGAKQHLADNNIEFIPAVNEELALTMVRGTQQLHWYEQPKHDGVFALWYGKMLGVDRAHEAIKMGNLEGSAGKGGVLLIAGDDHGGKSSATAQGSEQSLEAAYVPILYPSNTQEVLDYGLLGIAMSRFSGLYISLKCTNDTMEASASINVDIGRLQFSTPEDFTPPDNGLNILKEEFMPLPQEAKLMRHRLPAVQAFARANRLDTVPVDGDRRGLGIVTAGKAYRDVMQALSDMGIGQAEAARMGLRVYKLGMIWPIEPEGIREFVRGHREILVVEEKLGLIEAQLKDILYNETEAARRPPVVGKKDENGQVLVSELGESSPAMLLEIISKRLTALGDLPAELQEQIDKARSTVATAMAHQPSAMFRQAYFCSGCPHNTSTNVPDGSMSFAGVGCHAMAYFMDKRANGWAAAMGSEGALWSGLSRFTDMPHAYQNLGDGTYFHSGSLGLRQAVAAGANVTFKLLYNDAIAMTGGQPIDGTLTVDMMARQVAAEGVRTIVLVSDEPEKHRRGSHWPAGMTIRHRDELETVQKELSKISGTTVLIYEQTCAAEKRRRRKRGLFPDPDRRLFINEDVCEGCGDCSVQSNCLSVQPKDTEFGRKRLIDQSSCNKDFSCVKGFCPSFVSVKGGSLRKLEKNDSPQDDSLFDNIPAPSPVELERNYAILITGIGGTGVLTIGSILGMAAHLESKGCSVQDMTGMAQKGGAVLSHLRIAPSPEDIEAAKVGIANADLLLGCDLVVSGGMEPVRTLREGESQVVVNTHVVPTAGFQRDNKIDFQQHSILKVLRNAVGDNNTVEIDASDLAVNLLGDSIASNLIMTGVAWQRGLIPLQRESIEEAIGLNGVAVDMNKAAFNWGRLLAHDPQRVAAILAEVRGDSDPDVEGEDDIARNLDEIIRRRVDLLTDYQDADYAQRFTRTVERMRAAEAGLYGDSQALSTAVAKVLAKLMAYKDEYEVARLYTNGDFERRLQAQFEGDYELNFHMAPPILSKRDPETGHLQKRTFGPWMFSLLKLVAKLKRFRGTWLDINGYSEERKMERQLIADYEALVDSVIGKLNDSNLQSALATLELYDDVRGYGHVKEQNVQQVKARESELLRAMSLTPIAAVQIQEAV